MDIGIIGAGPGGIATAIRMLEAGHDDVVLLEKAAGVGGTWWHNRYPGLSCDIPSHLYSFSFAPKLDWKRPYGGRDEIHAYMDEVVDRFDLRDRIRFDTEVTAATWDDTHAVWRVTTRDRRSSSSTSSSPARHVQRAPLARDPGPRLVRRDAVPLGPLELGSRPHRRTRRRDRQRCERGAVHPRDREGRRSPHRVPARRELGAPAEDTPRPRSWVGLRDARKGCGVAARSSAASTLIVLGRRCCGLRRRPRDLEAVEDPELRRRLAPTGPYGCRRPLVWATATPFSRPNARLVTEGRRIHRGGHRRRRRARVRTLVAATGFRPRGSCRRSPSRAATTSRSSRRGPTRHAYLGIPQLGSRTSHAVQAEHQQLTDHLHRVPGRCAVRPSSGWTATTSRGST
jgi:hypothetical protein